MTIRHESQYTSNSLKEQNKIANLQCQLSRLVLFGKPVEQDYTNVQALIKADLSKDELGEEKRNAWKPIFYQGKQLFQLNSIEKISVIQYDKEDIKDTYDISGKISCQADVEGNPTIQVIASRQESPNLPLPLVSDVKLHPCVQVYSVRKNEINFQFTPPLGQFTLCKYMVEDYVKIPVRGFYQMKEVTSHLVKILIQLKLQETVNNHFEYFYVEIPFPNRTEINALELNPSIGNVSIHPKKKNVIVWNIGNKVGSKNLEMSLPGSIYFDPTSTEIHMTEDPFLKGHNSQIKLHFHILDWTVSGFHVSNKNVGLMPKSTTFKNMEIQKSVISEDYIIWNSLGDVRYCQDPE